MSPHASCALFVLAALSCGCSSSSSGSNGSDASSSSGGFTLRVDKASSRSSLGGLSAASGDTFLVLDVTLANDSVSSALPLNPVDFTVTTASSLVVHASPATSATSSPCRIDVGVASGGSASCDVAFAIGTRDVVPTLPYDDAVAT